MIRHVPEKVQIPFANICTKLILSTMFTRAVVKMPQVTSYNIACNLQTVEFTKLMQAGDRQRGGKFDFVAFPIPATG